MEIWSPRGGCTATARIARLMSRLQEYNFKVEHVPEKNNVTADCLSRLPCEKKENVEKVSDTEVIVSITDVISGEFKGVDEEMRKDTGEGDSFY